MPQLDTIAFFFEFVVLLIMLATMYLLMSFLVLPIIYSNIYVKNCLYKLNLNVFLNKKATFNLCSGIALYDTMPYVSLFLGKVMNVFLSVKITNIQTYKSHVITWLSGVWKNLYYFFSVTLDSPSHYIFMTAYFDKDLKKKKNKTLFSILFLDFYVQSVLSFKWL